MYDRNRDPQIDHAATDNQWLIEEMTAEQRRIYLDDERVDYNDQDHYDRKAGT